MLLIGIGHKARQGKDTAALAISDYYLGQRDTQELHGLPVVAPYVQRIGFADALYDVCRKEHGMVGKDAPLLQRVGAERRAIDPLYWVKKAFSKINPKANIVLIPDTRYWNEAEYIRSQGGFLLNVYRLNPDGTPYIASDRPSDHPSEIELDRYPWDFRIVNVDGHQGLLAEMAITLVQYLLSLKGIK